MTRRLIATFLALFLAVAGPVCAGERFIIVQSTTSTENSGLFEAILPQFEAASGIEVRIVAVGTGQAIRNAINGDGDALLVHAREAEEAFVAAGHGLARHDVMYNDFVIVGPTADPAGVKGGADAAAALSRIADAEAPFASRGDDSGTHRREMALWDAAGVDPTASSGRWYRETGSGMGATLNIAAGMGAYALVDRATWLAFANKRDLEILIEGDMRLHNQYGVIQVNPARHAHIRAADAAIFVGWLISDAGQAAIAAFRIAGERAFTPNASRQ